MNLSPDEPQATSRLPKFPVADSRERAWQKHWSRAGASDYELSVGTPGGDECEFLMHNRTPAKERARLKRITLSKDRPKSTLPAMGETIEF